MGLHRYMNDNEISMIAQIRAIDYSARKPTFQNNMDCSFNLYTGADAISGLQYNIIMLFKKIFFQMVRVFQLLGKA